MLDHVLVWLKIDTGYLPCLVHGQPFYSQYFLPPNQTPTEEIETVHFPAIGLMVLNFKFERIVLELLGCKWELMVE